MTSRYTIVGPLGRGGVGEVLLAEDAQLKRKVAIKRLHAEQGDEAAESLQQEATTLSSLNHPNVVTVHDVGIDEEGAYVVMEYLEGETFEELVERGALTWEDFQSVAVQSLEGLIAAQHHGLVHRDIKPGNLMLIWRPSGSFDVKLLDFGLAKFSPKPSKQTVNQGDAIMGSIFFMAPEQFERGHLDWRTDMYSLGAVFYYGLTGHYPFEGNTAPEVMAAHLEHRVGRLEELRPDVPVWACRWVHWLISRYQDDRPKDAVEALQVFVRAGEGLPESALEGSGVRLVTTATGSVIEQPIAQQETAQTPTRQTQNTPLPQQGPDRKWILWTGIGLAALIALVLILVFSLRPSGSEKRAVDLMQQGTLESVTFLETDESDYDLLYEYLQNGYDASAPEGSPETLGYAAVQAISKFQWGGADERILEDLSKEGNNKALLNLMRIAQERKISNWIDQVLPRFEKVAPVVKKNILASLNEQLALDQYTLNAENFEVLLRNFINEDDLETNLIYNAALQQAITKSENPRAKSRFVRLSLSDQSGLLTQKKETDLMRLLAAGGVPQDLQRFEAMLNSEDEREVARAVEALELAPEGVATKLLTEYALSLYLELKPSPLKARGRERRRFANRFNSAMRQAQNAEPSVAKQSLEMVMDTIQEWEYLGAALAALLNREEPWAGKMLDQVSQKFPQHAEMIAKERERRNR